MARLAVERVRHLVLFGEAAELIADAVAAASGHNRMLCPDPAMSARVSRRRMRHPEPGQVWIHRVSTLDEAVHTAALLARRGDLVLLSPGGTSFDAYRDFEERGEHFGRLVRALD